MNGNANEEEHQRRSTTIMINKRPTITCAGELEVFSAIEDKLLEALPEDSCEWRRSLGRPVRSVHIGANFTPFSALALPKGNQWDLIRQPLFHVYWTECSDVDLYKSTVKEDIESWVKELTSRDIPDYLIVVVENYDGKRTNKLLPRTTVLDKIRTDFAPKQGDRCISVINPGKSEARSADSWRGLVSRIRHLLLVAYARAVARLEDHVRQQRERRNEIGWNFMQYFDLQEELAQVLEMLGLHDEALVQYDELDALFSQFVVNGITGEAVSWLSEFQRPLEKWHGLTLGGATKLSKNPSLLELRAYLFTKQAQMMLNTKKVWEMASRCLPFLHTSTRELSVLEITYPPGAVSCWLFLAAMEVLRICDKYNHADEVEDYSLHTACLWAYASQKIRDLGELCGLMPGGVPTSEQLHIVVGLSAGMGDDPGSPGAPSPTDKLKEALCSQEAFNKTYLELAELAMCTYKHIGRLRSARLVGRDVASFYMLLNETQKAAAFLGDAVRTFEQDKWHELSAQTQIELAECHRKAGDTHKFVRAAASVAAALEIDTLIRWTYFDEMRKCLDALDQPMTVPFGDIVRIVSVTVKNDGVVVLQDSTITVELAIESNFPREIVCSSVRMSLESEEEEAAAVAKEKKGGGGVKYCKSRTLSGKDLKPRDPLLHRLQIQRHLDYKQDKQLASASVVCKHPESNKRKDSAAAPPKSDFSCFLQASNVPLVVTPGMNVIRLNKQASAIGKYYLGHAAIFTGNLHLISPALSPRLVVEVKDEPPTVRLHKTDAPLLSGLEQIMNLIITIGSYAIEPKSKIKLSASRGLTIQTLPEPEPLAPSVEIEVGERVPFTSRRMPLRVFGELLSKDHQVTIGCPWNPKPIVVKLSLTSPLTTSWWLHTVNDRKFVQINVTGQCHRDIYVENPVLHVGDGCCKVFDKNCQPNAVIPNGLSLSFMWELEPASEAPATIKAEFSVTYMLDGADSDNKLTYKYYFDIKDYLTLYILEASVEPTKGSEFCRDGTLCHLHLKIKSSGNSLDKQNNINKSVMYEVLAEQSVWAVCGRTAGVVSFDSEDDPQTVVLDVMPLTSGHLPLPLIRISKYIPADTADKSGKSDSHPRLEPFSPGQVYNNSKGKQVHVIAAVNDGGHVS